MEFRSGAEAVKFDKKIQRILSKMRKTFPSWLEFETWLQEKRGLIELPVKDEGPKFTPGPWQLTSMPIEISGNTDCAASIFGPFKNGVSPLICYVSRSSGDISAHANANLIAASPDMFKVLVGITTFVDNTNENNTVDELWKEAKKAI